MFLCGKLYFSLINSRFNGWMVCVVWLFLLFFCSLAGRACWCAHIVFDCQVLTIIQLDHVLACFVFKLLHVLVDRVVFFLNCVAGGVVS